MKKLLLAAIFAASASYAAAQTPPAKTVLEFDAQQLQWLSMAIQELPKKIADPFLADLQKQVTDKQKAAAPIAPVTQPTPPTKPEEPAPAK